VPKFLSALDRTPELEADVASTNLSPPKAIGPGKGLEERTRKLGNPSLGSEGLGCGRAPLSKPRRSSRHRLPPWSHSPPRLSLGWVSPMPRHQFKPNDLSCDTLGRLGAELWPAVWCSDGGRRTSVPTPLPRVGKTALHHPITIVRLRLEPAHTGSVSKSRPSILSPMVIIQW
jgi:hypothetical protein